MKVTGRCHCGQISFEAEIDPAQVRICHCTDCQTLTGTAFRTTVPSLPSSFVLKSGTPKIYIKTAESGNTRVHAFCPECGTPIYAAAPGANLPSHGLRVGTLDRRAELRPTRQRLHSLELQHVKSGAVVGEVHHDLRIDKAVCGLDDLRPVGTRGEHALWIGRHEKPSFARLARILDVKDPDAGIAAKMKRELRKAPGRFS